MPRNRTLRTTRTGAALLCATGLVLLATGCDDDDAAVGGDSTPPPSSARPSAGGDKAVDAEAGKTLPLGQTTRLTYVRSDKKLTLEATAKSVRKGSQDDLSEVRLDAKERALQPYYVTMSFKNIGDTTVAYPYLNTPTSLRDSRGESGKTLITIGGEVEGCPAKDPDDFPKGATATLCQVVLLPKDETPSVVVYQSDFDKDPFYWKAS
ncbi:hypothetical protein [Streptomyces corynorhini]|uniref:DUF4352 domain-containing protein n=1 Tax=Streptomyces corynorhini TaxID=2282652 RepID=A0A370B5G1_9ACTN|nr:hypothetical protein [Streptomyces corynorhini]RDG35103.1 hypothetical protein DVH02_27085 [Streptomyces corynorhini]